MNTAAPVPVFFHDLLGELAVVADTIELAHDHASIGAAGAGGAQPRHQLFDDVLKLIHGKII